MKVRKCFKRYFLSKSNNCVLKNIKFIEKFSRKIQNQTDRAPVPQGYY